MKQSARTRPKSPTKRKKAIPHQSANPRLVPPYCACGRPLKAYQSNGECERCKGE